MGVQTFGEDVLNHLSNFAEDVTSAVRTIDTDHAYIHGGIMFSATDYRSLTAGATSFITVLTPGTASGTYIHWRPAAIVSSADKVLVTLYEGSSTPTASGTVTPYNRDRTTTLTALLTVASSASITTIGTAIDRAYIGGGEGVGGARSGADTDEKHEIIFAQNQRYTMGVANNSTAANTVFLKLMWYEETGA